jgi:hypothetical protein
MVPHVNMWAAAVISDSGFDGFSYAAPCSEEIKSTRSIERSLTRDPMTTFAPRAARLIAMARPIPVAPPVTIAVQPWNSLLLTSLLFIAMSQLL